MPSGKSIDWSKYDNVLKSELPSLTIKDWQKLYAPHISDKTIGSRARKLGVKPTKYTLTQEHKKKISNSMIGDESYIVSKILEMRQDYSNSEIMKALGIDDATLFRIYKRNNIKLNELGMARARKQMRECSIGKMPWNKGSKLSDDTKFKISKALRGNNNGQFGKPIPSLRKQKMRDAYANLGLKKMRLWHTTEAALMARRKMINTKNTFENKKRASEISTMLVISGRLKHRGISSFCDTQKGGRFKTKSSYETAFVRILESDTNVISFKYETLRIPYLYGGFTRFYVPDFLVVFADGRTELVEIKPAKMVFLAKNQAKFEAAISYATDNSMEFRVITEDDLFTS